MSESEKKKFKIYLPEAVRGDWPFGDNPVAEAGVHDAIAGEAGAVFVVLSSGELLGVKPGEFKLIQ